MLVLSSFFGVGYVHVGTYFGWPTWLGVLLLNAGQHGSRGWVRARTPFASLLTAARFHCKSPVALIPYVPEGHGEQVGICSR